MSIPPWNQTPKKVNLSWNGGSVSPELLSQSSSVQRAFSWPLRSEKCIPIWTGRQRTSYFRTWDSANEAIIRQRPSMVCSPTDQWRLIKRAADAAVAPRPECAPKERAESAANRTGTKRSMTSFRIPVWQKTKKGQEKKKLHSNSNRKGRRGRETSGESID